MTSRNRCWDNDSMLLNARDARQWIAAWKPHGGYVGRLARLVEHTAERIRFAHQRRMLGRDLAGVEACLGVFQQELNRARQAA